MKPHVYIFRGAPASGKGTIVPEFARLLQKPVALIEQDKLRWGIHLIGRSVGDIGPDEHRFAYENTLLLYERYLETGKYTIVIEGLFTWDDRDASEGSVKELLDLAKKHGFDTTSIVLTADKEELIRRNGARTHVVPAEEFEALYNGVYQKQDTSEIIIDSTNKSLEETIAKLKQFIEI